MAYRRRNHHLIITIGAIMVLVFFAISSTRRLTSLRSSSPHYGGVLPQDSIAAVLLPAVTANSFVRLLDEKNNRSWSVPRRSREQCLIDIDAGVARYARTNESHLDILNGLGFHAALEMEDPRSRYCLCFEEYLDIWMNETIFSGESFFDWFDYGSGKKQNSTEVDCDRVTIDQFIYYRANPQEIADAEVEFKLRKGSDTIAAYYVGSGFQVQEGNWLLVWTLDHRFLLHSEEIHDMADTSMLSDELYYKIGHCSFTGGLPVLFAGEIGISLVANRTNSSGEISAMPSDIYKVNWITHNSGHYRTGFHQARDLCHWMGRAYGISQSTINWIQRKGRNATEPVCLGMD